MNDNSIDMAAAYDEVFGSDEATPPAVEENSPESEVVEQPVAPEEPEEYNFDDFSETPMSATDMNNISDYQLQTESSVYEDMLKDKEADLAALTSDPQTGEQYSVEMLTGADGSTGRTNMRTGEVFTDAEAIQQIQLMQAAKQEIISQAREESRTIARDMVKNGVEARYVMGKYGQLLKDNPELAEKLDGLFRNTMTAVNAEKGIYKRGKVSLKDFYDTALSGYAHAKKPVAQANNTVANNTTTPPTPQSVINGQSADFSANSGRKAMDNAVNEDAPVALTPDVPKDINPSMEDQVAREIEKVWG